MTKAPKASKTPKTPKAETCEHRRTTKRDGKTHCRDCARQIYL
ncbi:hypothetical protein O1L44_20185 [Streptomyces noursei]|nr:hypothetical protein SNOUR_24580 [Streptomyces noursei ATCC 11455]MCZ0994977.1 hypothetical protein [Streptomyces noursei]